MTRIKSKLVVKTAPQLFFSHYVRVVAVLFYPERHKIQFEWWHSNGAFVGQVYDNFRWADFICVWQSLVRAYAHNTLCPLMITISVQYDGDLLKIYRHSNTCHCLHRHVLHDVSFFFMLSINSDCCYSNMIIWNQQQSKILAHFSKDTMLTPSNRYQCLARSKIQDKEENVYRRTYMHAYETNDKRHLLVKT